MTHHWDMGNQLCVNTGVDRQRSRRAVPYRGK